MAKHSALFALGLTASVMIAAGAAQTSFAADIVHTRSDASPIAKMVTVPGGATTYYLSGMVAPVSNPTAPKDSIEAYGDTKTQTIGALTEIQKALAEQKLTMGDVVAMHVFLAGDPAKGGKMDFAGFQSAYTKYFATATQPNKPARTTVQVAGLAAAGVFVEIEATAAKLH